MYHWLVLGLRVRVDILLWYKSMRNDLGLVVSDCGALPWIVTVSCGRRSNYYRIILRKVSRVRSSIAAALSLLRLFDTR